MQDTTNLTPRQQRRAAAQRRRTHNVILAGLFLLVILVFFIVNLCVKDRDFSDNENRSLAQKPQFSWSALADGSYFAGLTDHFSDQFFARDGWLSLKLRSDKLLGKKDSGGVYLCRDDYLMTAPEEPDPVALPATITAVNSFTAAHPGISSSIMLVPDAASILPDKLPRNAPVRDQIQDIENVRRQLSGTIAFLDVSQALKDHAEEELYYHTDHHWTSLGARYAFESAIEGLRIVDAASDYDVYTVTDGFEGTLSSKSGSHSFQDSIQVYTPKGPDVSYYVTYPDQTRVCSLYQSQCLEAKDKYTVFFGGNHSILEISTTANNGRVLLMFKDSYANCFVQFLVPYYEKIILIDPRYYYDSVESVITQNGVTDMLMLYSADTFLTDTSLTDVLSAAQAAPAASSPAPAEPEPSPAPSAPAEAGSAEDQPSSIEESSVME